MQSSFIRCQLLQVYVEANGDPDIDHDFLASKKQAQSLAAALDRQVKEFEEAHKTNQNDPLLAELKKSIKETHTQLIKALPEKDNQVVASLTYPRAGQSSIVTQFPLALGRGEDEGITFAPSVPFAKNGLFKELIQGETTLQISIIDSDKMPAALKFTKNVLSGALNAVTGGAWSSIANPGFKGAADAATAQLLETILSGEGKKGAVIAQSAKVGITIDKHGALVIQNSAYQGIHFANNKLTLDLVTPNKVLVQRGDQSRAWFLGKGRPNGAITLQFTTHNTI